MLKNQSFRFCATLSCFLIAAATIGAQQNPALSGEPVTISFRALTSAGSPVIDLTAADIVLKVGGRERAIRTFERLRLGEGDAVSAIPPAFATNVLPATGLRDTLVVIDDQSIPPGEEKRFQSAVEQYLAGLGAADRVGVISVQDRGLNVLMTNDRDKVRAGLKAFTGRAPSMESADDAACRTRRVLGALNSLAASAPPGSVPVTVMMFTAGTTPPGTSTTMTRMGGGATSPSNVCEVQPRDYQEFQRATLASSMNLYVVAAALSPSSGMQQGIENLAGASGNPLMELAKMGDSDMSRVARENTAWYRVTFVAEANERNGELQRVDVQAKRAGVVTRSRSQVLIARPAASTQPASAKDMLRESRVHRDFEFRAAAHTSQEPGSDKVKVVVLLEPVEPGTVFKSAVVGLFDAQGKLTVQGTAEATNLGRSPAMMAVLANPGKYRLRVAAVDAANRGGTVDIDVDVALTRAGVLQLGSMILGVADGGSFAGRLQFSSEPAAIGYVEVYGLPAGAQLSAQLEIAESETGRALATAATKILGDGADGRRVILGGASIAQLPAGDILFRMVVNLDGKPVGQVVRTLHKTTR